MEKLKSAINEIQEMTNDEWLKIKEIVRVKSFKAKSHILDAGDIAGDIFFIEQGLIRIYHLENGKEINTYFGCDGQFISAFTSLITQMPSNEYIESLEDSIVYTLPYDSLNKLYIDNPRFEKFGRIYAEQSYLCIANRTVDLQAKHAKQKYLDFTNNHKSKIVQRMPQRHIASYLGIEPESLSRIRKQIVIS